MPKAVLVMDMPESCGQCNFKDFGADGILTCICIEDYMELEDDMDKLRPDWCPLHELPEKERNDNGHDEYSDGYDTGWNACLDDILKPEKERVICQRK